MKWDEFCELYDVSDEKTLKAYVRDLTEIGTNREVLDKVAGCDENWRI